MKAMTEKEKMLSGVLYDARHCREIVDELRQCEEFCFHLNQVPPSQRDKRRSMFRQLLGKTGEEFTIIAPFFCDFGKNISIGERFFANTNMVVLDEARVTFGDDVFVGPNCSFYCAEHPLDAEQRNKGYETAYPITIGNSVWLGGNVTVLSGVTIGNNCVVGAGSVVVKDIPPYSVAVGNPCRVIRRLNPCEDVSSSVGQSLSVEASSETSAGHEKGYTYRYPHPAVTADSVVLCRRDGQAKVLLIQRKFPPCEGQWAFPGGFMNIDETTEEAARRELMEETGIGGLQMAEVGVFSRVDRDPRERVITVAYVAVTDRYYEPVASDDASMAQWFDLNALPELAFDHAEILQRAMEKVGMA